MGHPAFVTGKASFGWIVVSHSSPNQGFLLAQTIALRWLNKNLLFTILVRVGQ
jgi:hypothetical protein